MPNNITNRIVVDGDEADIIAMFAAISDKDNVVIDFNKIIPMPESLNIVCGSDTEKAFNLYNKFEESTNTETTLYEFMKNEGYESKIDEFYRLIKLGKKVSENIQNYGHPTWYEWSLHNWGTKWNAYKQQRFDQSTIEFWTAWSGVPDLICRLSEKFPNLIFHYQFADEDYGYNVGEYQFENGEIIFANEPVGGSAEALEISKEIFGAYELDDEYDVEN